MMDFSALLSAFPALQALDPAAQSLLRQSVRPVRIPAGTRLFADGDPCQAFLLVRDGCVRVQKVGENGREIVLYRVEGGQTCVLTTVCLMAHRDYGAEGIAEQDIDGGLLPAPVFTQLLASSAGFREFAFTAYATRVSDLLMLIEDVAFGRIDSRLAALLVNRCGADGVVVATHQDLAAELGSAREVISRQLKEFERRGWIALHRGRLTVLHPDELSALTRTG
ncbi:Crp/Fnr family transcriptional regulator [Novispirillum itersonii]|uniref:CRP/FNR family transcriptional regulator n=1 Tax=Novispirillum itersonii TaxID=189 RepID=A0A7W9ZFV7_NOVIT|nr:Crp/Fnr family transcriptional regulator [Novispirillum itersonii]MBB6210731.1 CRP/FNR family transcriptional regulator [Novispirillum itersonii]